MKHCSTCKKELSLSLFHKNKGHKDGYSGQCKNCVKAYSKKYWQQNKDRLKQGRKLYWQQYYQENKEKVAKTAKEWLKRLKVEVFEVYGGAVCVCCKEIQLMFLSLDHVNGGGNKEREKVMGSARYAGYHFYQWLKNNQFPDRDKYQVLCMNCQFGRAHNKGVCPHELC